MTITVLSTIYESRLNARGDVLRLDHTESNGRQMIDLRRWYTDDDGELKPTTKGVTIAVEKCDEVSLALNGFIQRLKAPPAKVNRTAASNAKKKTATR